MNFDDEFQRIVERITKQRSLSMTNEQFLRLMQEVEDQGGIHLDERCNRRRYTFTGPKSKPAILPGCGNQTLFEVPYDLPEQSAGNVPMQDRAKMCAICDYMGLMPRFADAVRG